MDTSGLSETVRPGDDVYRYGSAGWLATAQVSPGIAHMDAYAEVYLATEQRVKRVRIW